MSRPLARPALRLLLKLKEEQRLPNLSDRLGHVVRTNSEAILCLLYTSRCV